ncbi:tRNA lysidine(34) synthetase TilS [Aliiglaciecola litoralis]
MSVLNTLTDRLSDFLDCSARQIVIGYSGGVDSHLLLHAVASLTKQFSQHRYLAVYVNHGLSEHADKWQAHCGAICEALAMPFRAIRVDVDPQSPQGIEAAARSARYRALESVTEHHGIILLGQHQDDQLETFLLQLKRGAGPKGLSAMPQELTRENGVRLVRPMLGINRDTVLQLAKQANLQWIEDESNQDERFDRNFLRQQIVPKMLERWPDMAQAVQRSAHLCAEQQRLLDEVTLTYLSALQNDDNALHIPSLLRYSSSWQNQIVRLWLAQQGVPLPSQAVLLELPSLLTAKRDAEPKIVFGDFQFRRFREYLYCIECYQSISSEHEFELDGQQIIMPNRLGKLHFSLIPEVLNQGRLYLRSVALSFKFKPATEPHSKPLKQWFKLWDIPVWQREQSLMLFHDNVCLGVCINGKLIFSHDAPVELKDKVAWHASAPVL